MRKLDIHRHAMRQKPGNHLSQDGIELARYVGRTLNSYERVLTSTLPRAIQTAVAMGFAITETVEELGAVHESIVQRLQWPADLSAINISIAACAECTALAESQASLWEEIAAHLSDGAAGLIITHGAILELGVVATLRRISQAIDGEAFAYCEGVRVYFGDHSVERVEQLRLPREKRLIDS